MRSPARPARATVTLDEALLAGKSLFKQLYGKRWRHDFIDSMVDDKDWVLAESSGDIQWHFGKTGGSMDQMMTVWKDDVGGELVADIEAGWALTYLNAGAIEHLVSGGADVSTLRTAWSHLAILQNWAVEALRALPSIETVEVVRATTFDAQSVEHIQAGFSYDWNANPHLSLEDPTLGWLWKGMLYAGVPPVADERGGIPDFVLPDKTVTLTLELRDDKGRTIPSIPHTRPAPCPLCWGRPSPRGRDGTCPTSCVFGDTGSLPDPNQVVYATGSPPEYDPGVEVVYMMYGGDKSTRPRRLRSPAEYSTVKVWIASRVEGKKGGRPSGPPPGLAEYVTSLAGPMRPKWGERRDPSPSDAEIAQRFNELNRGIAGMRPVTASSVERMRHTLGVRRRGGRLALLSPK
jgi:hypothetical protein